jgi:hypothetical protein
VARDWAERHGQPCTLTLTGPEGGTLQFGGDGPSLRYDAIEFCRILSGRGEGGSGLLRTRVPFSASRASLQRGIRYTTTPLATAARNSKAPHQCPVAKKKEPTVT